MVKNDVLKQFSVLKNLMYTKYDRYHLHMYCKISIKWKSMAYILDLSDKKIEILNNLISENYNLNAKCLNLVLKKDFTTYML